MECIKKETMMRKLIPHVSFSWSWRVWASPYISVGITPWGNIIICFSFSPALLTINWWGLWRESNATLEHVAGHVADGEGFRISETGNFEMVNCHSEKHE